MNEVHFSGDRLHDGGNTENGESGAEVHSRLKEHCVIVTRENKIYINIYIYNFICII